VEKDKQKKDISRKAAKNNKAQMQSYWVVCHHFFCITLAVDLAALREITRSHFTQSSKE
jgi:hypothetical protein